MTVNFICICQYSFIYLGTFIRIIPNISECVGVDSYVHAYIYIYIYICVCVCVCVCAFTSMNINVYEYVYVCGLSLLNFFCVLYMRIELGEN